MGPNKKKNEIQTYHNLSSIGIQFQLMQQPIGHLWNFRILAHTDFTRMQRRIAVLGIDPYDMYMSVCADAGVLGVLRVVPQLVRGGGGGRRRLDVRALRVVRGVRAAGGAPALPRLRAPLPRRLPARRAARPPQRLAAGMYYTRTTNYHAVCGLQGGDSGHCVRRHGHS